jgi:hypothetical protein
MLLLRKALAGCMWGFSPSAGSATRVDIKRKPESNEPRYKGV